MGNNGIARRDLDITKPNKMSRTVFDSDCNLIRFKRLKGDLLFGLGRQRFYSSNLGCSQKSMKP